MKYDHPERTGLSGEGRRVVRGGSWSRAQVNARAPARDHAHPGDRLDVGGLRVVCAAPLE